MVKFDAKGLLPAIAQDAQTSEVLMLAYMNQEALEKTLTTGQAWFYSRSRQELWHKGATSGNYLNVRDHSDSYTRCWEDANERKTDGTGCTGNRDSFQWMCQHQHPHESHL